MARIPREVEAPCLLIVAWGAEEMPLSKLDAMGFKIAVYPGDLQQISAFAMREAAKILKEAGTLESLEGRMLSYPERFELAGYDAVREVESRFLPAE